LHDTNATPHDTNAATRDTNVITHDTNVITHDTNVITNDTNATTHETNVLNLVECRFNSTAPCARVALPESTGGSSHDSMERKPVVKGAAPGMAARRREYTRRDERRESHERGTGD